MNVWDFVNAINQSKEDLFVDPQADKDYIPFIVNKSLGSILYISYLYKML